MLPLRKKKKNSLLQSDQEQLKQEKEEFVISLKLLKIFLWFKISTATITTMKVVLKWNIFFSKQTFKNYFLGLLVHLYLLWGISSVCQFWCLPILSQNRIHKLISCAMTLNGGISFGTWLVFEYICTVFRKGWGN